MDELTEDQCRTLKEWGLPQNLFEGDRYYFPGQGIRCKTWATTTTVSVAGMYKIPTTDALKMFVVTIMERLYPGADTLLITFFSPRIPGWGAKVMRVPMQSDDVLFWVPVCQSEPLALYKLITQMRGGERDGPE